MSNKTLTAEQVENRRAVKLKYSRSEKGRAKLKAYAASAAGKRSHYLAVKKHREKNRDATIARGRINDAIRYGKLVKPTDCEACGSESALHGHHASYSRPLDVQWLCVPCHTVVHKDPLSCEEHF